MSSSVTIALYLVALLFTVTEGVNELQKCENGLGIECGSLIYNHVFEAGKEVSKECCARLITVGKDCHDLLTEVTIVYKRLPEKKAREILQKNDKAWENCRKTVAASRGGSNELQICENGLGAKCGHIIYQNVFESKNELPAECCNRLLTVGKDCHDLLTEVTIVYKRLSIKEGKQIWLKNDKVWEQCWKN